MSLRQTLVPLAAVLAGLFSATLSAQGESSEPKIRIPVLQSLTVTGEYRVRFEEVYNYDLNKQTSDDRDFFTQRFRLNFDAEVNEQLSVFVQFQDVRLWGEETATTDGSADGLDVHRAYLRYIDTPIGGDAKVGRQVLAFGDERLVGGLEWLSQGRAFDGYRHTWRAEDSYTLDVFAASIRERPPSATYDDAYFAGLYASIDSMDDTELELYWLFLNDEETTAGGNEARSTLGFRFEQQYGGLEVGVEAATQFGEMDNADIDIGDTHAFHAHLQWTFGAASKPWVRLEGNYATGNDPATPENERFKNLFPTAHAHWGMMDFALWENLMHAMAEIGMKPAENSKLAVSWHMFESAEETDRFVGPVGRIAPTGSPAGTSNSIGNELDLFYNIEFDTEPARTWVQLGYGMFLPGSGARTAAGADDTAHFFYLMTGVTF